MEALVQSNFIATRKWHNEEVHGFLDTHMRLVLASCREPNFIHRLPFAYSKGNEYTTVFFLTSKTYET